MNSTRDSLNNAIPVKIWIVKEVVGPVHSAQDSLTDTPMWNAHVNKKKKRKKRGKRKRSIVDANPNA